MGRKVIKKLKKGITVLTFLVSMLSFSQIGIGTHHPDLSAQPDIKSTRRGLILSRIPYVQKTAIVAPASGLIVWFKDCGTAVELQLHKGNDWFNMVEGTAYDVPDVATNSNGTLGNTKVRIANRPPLPNYGRTITGYTIPSYPGGANLHGTFFSHSSSGLSNGTSYSFKDLPINATAILEPSSDSLLVKSNCGAYTNNGTFLIFACHNLGADTSLHAFKYQSGNINGDLYQWGRFSDGHQKRKSETINEQADNKSATCKNDFLTGKFIYGFTDWIVKRNDALWGDGTTEVNPAKATNDPCPKGFKVPSQFQWASIFKGGASSDVASSATANDWKWTGNGYLVGPSLYLPAAGTRNYFTDFYYVGVFGYYWSSSVAGADAFSLYFNKNYVYPSNQTNRADGMSIRCIAE